MKRGRAALLAATVVALCPHSVADAAENISVTVEGCRFDAVELERLVQLELSSVLEASDEPSSYVVSLRCADASVKVTLVDPLTSKTLERAVVVPGADVDEPERMLAITVAQLYRASWLELRAPPPPAREPLPPVEPPRVSPGEIEAATRIAAPHVDREGPPPAASVSVAIGPRARRLQSPTVLPSLELGFAWSPLRILAITITGGVEYTNVDRPTGSVDVVLGKGNAGVLLEPFIREPWSVFVEIGLGVAAARMSASEVAPGYTAGTVVGMGFEGNAGAGAAFRAGPIRLELGLRGGGLRGTPTARVDGGDSIVLEGLWAGADLRTRLSF